jgi:hypothetical protein
VQATCLRHARTWAADSLTTVSRSNLKRQAVAGQRTAPAGRQRRVGLQPAAQDAGQRLHDGGDQLRGRLQQAQRICSPIHMASSSGLGAATDILAATTSSASARE